MWLERKQEGKQEVAQKQTASKMVSETKTGTDNTMEKRKMMEKHEANIYRAGTEVSVRTGATGRYPGVSRASAALGRDAGLRHSPLLGAQRLFHLSSAGKGGSP